MYWRFFSVLDAKEEENTSIPRYEFGKISSIFNFIGSAIAIIISFVGINWPDFIFTSLSDFLANPLSSKFPLFMNQLSNNFILWSVGDVPNILKLGISLLNNALRIFKDSDLSIIPLPLIGYLTKNKIFIVNLILDLSMTIGFLYF